MGFNVAAAGSRQEVAAQLRAAVVTDPLGMHLRDVLAGIFTALPDLRLEGVAEYRYVAELAGTSAPGDPPRLTAVVRSLIVAEPGQP